MRELEHLLDRLQVPAADESRAARALDRSLTALRNASKAECKTHWMTWIFPVAATTACVVLALVMYRQSGDSSARIFEELERLFPGQLQAVVQHAGQTDLRLSVVPNPKRSTDQRVRITVRSDGETTDILTYSGSEVCVPVKSGALSLTPLVTGEGDVLVLAGDNAFTRSGRVYSATIHATALTRS